MHIDHKSMGETQAKPHVLWLILLGLVLFFTLFAHKPVLGSEISMAPSLSARQLLSHSSTTQQSTMELHPKQTPKNHHQFEAAAHEVPSGPNPKSNK
ncbi:CLAVATA3/ESR (CLE)-related protein 41-like [Quillaja saponaria]|uniref:CLAVATA3/ESR (CLE)-related protein 41-like n=1 Tax=Quillaja saponaria TaxID=32244 RepID=A0AAD7VL20_QUISA|nr:CLAVATA3/ESR (CLE)-related protein 41-like [Quillaja saponaria]